MSFNPIIVRLKPELGIPTASFPISFNPIIVRLKPLHLWQKLISPNLFQSYNSTIKTGWGNNSLNIIHCSIYGYSLIEEESLINVNFYDKF